MALGSGSRTRTSAAPTILDRVTQAAARSRPRPRRRGRSSPSMPPRDPRPQTRPDERAEPTRAIARERTRSARSRGRTRPRARSTGSSCTRGSRSRGAAAPLAAAGRTAPRAPAARSGPCPRGGWPSPSAAEAVRRTSTRGTAASSFRSRTPGGAACPGGRARRSRGSPPAGAPYGSIASRRAASSTTSSTLGFTTAQRSRGHRLGSPRVTDAVSDSEQRAELPAAGSSRGASTPGGCRFVRSRRAACSSTGVRRRPDVSGFVPRAS